MPTEREILRTHGPIIVINLILGAVMIILFFIVLGLAWLVVGILHVIMRPIQLLVVAISAGIIPLTIKGVGILLDRPLRALGRRGTIFPTSFGKCVIFDKDSFRKARERGT
jgi:hypothetical protein